MKLTDEQANAVDLFKTSQSLKISAFAGTGKTSTLVEVGKATRRNGLYLAFNKKVATEAVTKFPKNVDCKTTHALAYRAVANIYGGDEEKLTQRLRGNHVAQLLNLEEIAVGNITLKPRSLGFLTAKTIQRFCQSGDDELVVHHVPLFGKLRWLDPEYRDEFREYVSKLAAHLWDRMLDPASDAPLGHDGYLKRWSLSRPKLNCDFLLLDEAQDTNEAVLSVLRIQDSHLTLVGDRYQQIYEWRGAINAMASVKTEAETALTRSFRFGDSVADAATSILRILGETKRVVGDPNRDTKIAAAGSTGTTICRTNAGVVKVVVDALAGSRRPHVVGGIDDLVGMLQDVSRLKRRTSAVSPEFFGFANWAEVVEFSESEEGEYLRSFVKIVPTHGEVVLLQMLGSVSPDAAKADLIVSTGHKAKGQEWDSVTLFSDFEPRLNKENPPKLVLNEEEARLLYVAVTRARKLLVVPSRLAERWNVPATRVLATTQPPVAAPISRMPAKPLPQLPQFARPVLPSLAEKVK
ncbi:UvrD-helicase domain-containing protein [Massilia horti]|uniref:DNA 3'-5' helicase n=1 Tax=Massilia horti TaxID=2562153 RepID=A0A4Y9T1W7_9BURK|nr:UvrD-helicase domain-containing protein [Massilia horti]TFW33598.1 ATP-dependent helicase [Massilia horti]